MSTLELEHLKHTSSSSNNLSVHSDGSLTLGMLQGNVGIGTVAEPNRLLTIAGSSNQWDANLRLKANTHATSRRCGVEIDQWNVLSDLAGTNDGGFGIYSSSLNQWVMQIDSAGSVRHNQNACYESNTGSFSSQGSSSLNNMDFGSGLTARFNQGSVITYAHTNGGRFTVSNAGMYEITLQSFLDLNGDIRAYFVQMNRNGASYTTWGHHSSKLVTATTHDLAVMHTLANLGANDYLEFKYRMYDSPTVTVRPRLIIKQVG